VLASTSRKLFFASMIAIMRAPPHRPAVDLGRDRGCLVPVNFTWPGLGWQSRHARRDGGVREELGGGMSHRLRWP
jgi:hypothetical protein